MHWCFLMMVLPVFKGVQSPCLCRASDQTVRPEKLKAFRKIMWHCNLALWNRIRVSTGATTSVWFSKKGAQSWSVDHSKVLSRRGVMERYHGRPNLTTLWIAPRQQGVGGSLQVGWSHCRGSYIARLDADDEATGWNVHEIWAKYGKIHDIPCIKHHQARKVMVFCSLIYSILISSHLVHSIFEN